MKRSYTREVPREETHFFPTTFEYTTTLPLYIYRSQSMVRKRQSSNHHIDLLIPTKATIATRLSRERAGNGPLDLGGSTRPDAGAGDGVAGDVATVDVVGDALVGGGVKLSAGNALGAVLAGVGGSRAGDLNVDALRVVLRTIL